MPIDVQIGLHPVAQPSDNPRIKHNTPLGLPDSLSDQQAWDVAAYMNSHERPQDPRPDGDLAATTEQFHGGKFDYYGKRRTVGGRLLGEQPAGR